MEDLVACQLAPDKFGSRAEMDSGASEDTAVAAGADQTDPGACGCFPPIDE